VRKKPALAGLAVSGVLAVVLGAVAVGLAVLATQAETARKVAEDARDQVAEQKKEVEAARDGEAAQRQAAEQVRDQLAGEQTRTAEARDEAVKQKELAEKAKEAAEKAQSAAEKAQAAEAEARRQVEREREKLAVSEYGVTMRVADQEWRDKNVAAMRALLDGADPKLRNWEWRYLNRLSDPSLLTLKGHSGGVTSASFSPDGTRIVTGSGDKTAKVWDAKTGAEVLTLKGHTDAVVAASFSPDGTRIVTGSHDNTAKVWDSRPLTAPSAPEKK